MDTLDTFRVRFCDLQDSLGNKTFRSILLLKEESIEAKLNRLSYLWDEWEEQKIDLILRKRSEPNSPSHTITQSTGILLK